VTPTGKWVADFNVGRQYALKFWEVCGSGRTFALEFQQVILGMLTTAKTYKDASYSGIEAGFLLAVGELSGGVIHIHTLLQNREARAPRNRVVDEALSRNKIGVGRYTQDDWEFGVSQ
jgi:tRNA G37 N-methylase Trm5